MKTHDITNPVSSASIMRGLSLKSTGTKAQYERIAAMLRTGPKNTMELRRAGVMMPAARIKEMNDRHGYQVPRINLVDLWDEWGYCHKGVALYELIDEPSDKTV